MSRPGTGRVLDAVILGQSELEANIGKYKDEYVPSYARLS